MAGKPTIVGAVVREMLTRFPDATNLQLARICKDKHPSVFVSIQSARSAVRYYRGARGDDLRADVADPMPLRGAYERRQWGMLLPEPAPREWAEYPLPTDASRWLVLADLHMPYYDRNATEAAIEHGIRSDCDGVLLLGDVLDFYQLSRYCKDPRMRRVKDEIDGLWRFIEAVRDAIHPKRIIWKLGNHEQRYERYLMQHAPELYDVESFTFESAVRTSGSGVDVIPPMSPIRYGKLSLLHGHEWPAGFVSPVNPARGAFLRAVACTLTGHQHRTSEHTETTLDEKTITCWSVGCLCDLRPMYRPVANRWNHGFVVLRTEPKTWTVGNHRIIDGAVL